MQSRQTIRMARNHRAAGVLRTTRAGLELGLNEPSEKLSRHPKQRARRSPLRNLAGAAVVILVAIGLAILLTYCSRSPDSGGGPASGRAHGRGGASSDTGGRPQITVGVATATTGAVPIELAALGTVTPQATIHVASRVSGLLSQVRFTEGQVVRRGQILAIIDPRPFEVAVQQARATLLRDQAALESARQDLSRYQTLRAQDSIARQTYDTQVALVRQDEATVAADQAAVANARLSLSFTRVDSPVTGRVGLRQVDAGNQITANQTTPLAVVTQVNPISVVFTLPETAIGAVTRHHAGIGLPVSILDRSGGSVLAKGKLATLDNQIDTTTGTVKAKAVFDNPDGSLFPNQFVNVVLLADTLRNQVIVPATAIRHGPQSDFVWVLAGDGSVKSRPVTVGPGTAETVSIATGLKAGETVITDGGDRLRDGARVTTSQAHARGAGVDAGGTGRHGHGGGPGGRRGGGKAPTAE
jgi:multidrug efflux system membrane fusion protein